MVQSYGRTIALLLALMIFLSAAVPGCPAAAMEMEEPQQTEVTEPEELEQTLPLETESLETEPAPEETLPQLQEQSQEAPVSPTAPEAHEEPTQTQSPSQEAEPPMETLPQAPEERLPVHSIQVPQFFQTDYPDVLYSAGTVASDGCSITCLAMVATYMTGYPYLPDELAGYFGGYLENVVTNLQRLEAASDLLQLPWRRAENFQDAMDAMKAGKVVIAMMNQESIFTDSQHFIVLAGTTEDGRILVNDPYEPNYDHWRLKNAFLYGFREEDLIGGFSGGWIYDKAAMPENPFVYTEEEVEVECRYPGLELSREDRELLARMVWVEARGETDKGQQAVAEVVLNRLVAEDYSDNLRDIIYSSNQFRATTWLDEAEPTQTQYEAVEAALKGPYVLPMDVVHFATYPVNSQVWGTIGGHVFCYRWRSE